MKLRGRGMVSYHVVMSDGPVIKAWLPGTAAAAEWTTDWGPAL